MCAQAPPAVPWERVWEVGACGCGGSGRSAVCEHETWQHSLDRARHALASNQPLQRLVYRFCHIECVLTFYMCVWQSLMKCAPLSWYHSLHNVVEGIGRHVWEGCKASVVRRRAATHMLICAHLKASAHLCCRRVGRLKHCDATWYERSGREERM